MTVVVVLLVVIAVEGAQNISVNIASQFKKNIYPVL